ncbi:MAG TPA: hypothetical protein VFB54_12235 [Burkholderiales bacterium]|nr:hypothetical protein [Burkholderiales bacterium]
MGTTLIGTYESREETAQVREELIRLGIAPEHIHIYARDDQPGVQPPREERSASAFIDYLFRDDRDDVENLRRYETHAQRGGGVLIVELPNGKSVASARSVMARTGDVDVYERPDAVRADATATTAIEAMATVEGPQGNALPNAPTGWNTSRAGSPATIGQLGHDPARPQGLTRDTEGWDANPAHESSGPSANRVTGVADAGEAPDPFGHRIPDSDPGRGRSIPRK